MWRSLLKIPDNANAGLIRTSYEIYFANLCPTSRVNLKGNSIAYYAAGARESEICLWLALLV